ncbi:MAG: hypothetical protein MK137_00770 [Rickettsiales bacterium]|nr:hypothetical protein [Rickettsiales bacterium]
MIFPVIVSAYNMIKTQATNVFHKVSNSFKIPALWKRSKTQENSQNQPYSGEGKDTETQEKLTDTADQLNNPSLQQTSKPKRFWTKQVTSNQNNKEIQGTHR